MEKLYSWFERAALMLPADNEFERGFFAALLLSAA